MELDYQQMGTDERLRHHDDLRDDGYQWCPECGETLIWELPLTHDSVQDDARPPVVCGDIPPLTAEQLLMTVPAAH